MDRTTDLVIPGVNERDVDLLLLEEFLSSAEFGAWFIARLDPDLVGLCCVDARRSVIQANGESDVEVDFSDSAGRRLRILIENKVGAGLQPQQAERYVARGEHYRHAGECNAVISVIVAPARYFADAETTKGFDRRLDYESLLEWFEGAEHLGARRRYKAALLRCAIDKGTLGYQPVADDLVTEVWRGYWMLTRELAPELEMREPIGKPAKAGFVLMQAPVLASIGVRLRHKIKKGKVDLELPGMGRSLNFVHDSLEHLLEDGMSIQQAQQSAAVRITVPVLSTVTEFDQQRETAVYGVRAAQRMLKWAVTHQAAITQLMAKR